MRLNKHALLTAALIVFPLSNILLLLFLHTASEARGARCSAWQQNAALAPPPKRPF